MRRGARFFVLDQGDDANASADYIVLDIPPAQIGPLIAQLEKCKRFDEMNAFARAQIPFANLPKSERGTWAISLLVEASHPKTVGKDPKDVQYTPSLLKDSIPRPGRS